MRSLAGKRAPVLGALLALACAGILPAQSDDTRPSFFIEKITVLGTTWISKQTVVDSALLVEQRVYSERDLRAAMSRVVRLGFVLDASFSLRRGSRREAYELQIQIVEAQPLSLNGSLSWDASADRSGSRWDHSYLAGGRLFLGSDGMLTAAVVDDLMQDLAVEPATMFRPRARQLTIGYTQYRLFDRHVFGSVQLWRSLEETVSTACSATLGLRLPRNQTLSVAAMHRDRSYLLPRPPFPDRELRLEYENVSLEWRQDTSDDLWRPTRGRRLSLALGDFRFRDPAIPERPGVPRWSSYYFSRATAQGAHALSGTQVVAVDGSVELGRHTPGSIHRLIAAGGVEHAVRPFAGRRIARNHEAWLQTRVDLLWKKSFVTDGSNSTLPTATVLGFSTGLRYRNPWGTVDLRVIWSKRLR